MLRVGSSPPLTGGLLGIWGKCEFFSSGALSAGHTVSHFEWLSSWAKQVRSHQAYEYSPVRVKILTPPYLTNPMELPKTESTEKISQRMFWGKLFAMLYTAAEYYSWRNVGWGGKIFKVLNMRDFIWFWQEPYRGRQHFFSLSCFMEEEADAFSKIDQVAPDPWPESGRAGFKPMLPQACSLHLYVILPWKIGRDMYGAPTLNRMLEVLCTLFKCHNWPG